MVFNSWSFLVFFIVFFGFYYGLRRNVWLQNALIWVSSYFFYGAWDIRFLLLIMCCTTTDFITGLALSGRRLDFGLITRISGFLASVTAAVLLLSSGRAAPFCLFVIPYVVLIGVFIVIADRLSDEKRRTAYLVGSIVYNLTVLSFFKYFHFFIENAIVLGKTFGLRLDPPLLHVILPVGISFFTFQSMSFSLDVYRGQLKPTDQLLKFAAYISFFPQLVAGPIERAAHLLPQFDRERVLSWEAIRSGSVLFVWGLYKKLVIADNVAPIADAAFNNASNMSSTEMLVGALAFTVQIYCDFSGYSDMARALARMLGFELMVNFNLPYFARTPAEFWRRWHISLSSWLRDYLYIGLGGNRDGPARTYRNIMITMILGGLWHGASWTFILWGVYHGAIQVVYRLFGIDRHFARDGITAWSGPARHLLAWAVMSLLTVIGWIIFRSQDLTNLFRVTHSLVSFTSAPTQLAELARYTMPLAVFEVVYRFRDRLQIVWWGQRFAYLNVGLFVLCSLFFMSARGGQQFIYFDF